MEYSHKTESLLHLMRNLKAVVSKCQEQSRHTWIKNHKPETDHNIPECDSPQIRSFFSENAFVKKFTLIDNFENGCPFSNPEETPNRLQDSKCSNAELSKLEDSSSASFTNQTYSTSKSNKPTKSVSDINPLFGDANESFRMKNQRMNRLQFISFDPDCFLGKGCSKAKWNGSSDFISEKDRLSELIKSAAEENFALRDSNVKLLHQRKLQNLRIRDLKHKISLQNQRALQQKAEERTKWGLENIIRDKLLEIQSLKRELKFAQEQLRNEASIATPKVEPRSRRRSIFNVNERTELKTPNIIRKAEKEFNISSLASKLNYLLVKLSKDAESCSEHLKFLEEKVDFLSQYERLHQKR